MKNSIYTLVYLSTSQSVEIPENELLSIVEKSIKNNSQNGLTGILIFAEGVYIQALEGTKEKVLEVYNKVKKDSRHFGITKVLEYYHDVRIFEKWSMGFKRTSVKNIGYFLAENNEIENNDLVDLIKSEKTKTLSFLHSFYENNFENQGMSRF